MYIGLTRFKKRPFLQGLNKPKIVNDPEGFNQVILRKVGGFD